MSASLPLLPPHVAFDAHARGLVMLVGLHAGPSSLDHESMEVCLHGRGIATLDVKLLPRADSDTPPDVAVLVARLSRLLREVAARADLSGLPLGLCCGRAEATAVLTVAASHADQVKAVVLLGGEVAVPGHALGPWRTPLLMIVGPGEFDVLGANRQLGEQLGAHTRLEVLPAQGYLFADSGLGTRKAELAADWFARHLTPQGAHAGAATCPHAVPHAVPQTPPGRHWAEVLKPRHSEADGSS